MKRFVIFFAAYLLAIILSIYVGYKVQWVLTWFSRRHDAPMDLERFHSRFSDPCKKIGLLRSGKRAFSIDELKDNKIVRVLSLDRQQCLIESILDSEQRQYFLKGNCCH